jgi:ethanolamine utilization protein EutN
MRICRVVGTVVATVHQHDFDGLKLLLCQPLDDRLHPKGRSVIAADRVQAGVGDLVLVMSEGNGCRQLWGVALEAPLAIRSAIVGIIDAVDVPERAEA